MEQKELLTVIVADDETELREAVCSMIPWKEIGFRLVGSAGNGLDALQLVEQLQPDLLLTDIRMPYISGVSLAQQVRELRPLTQIAFLSGYDDFAYAQKAIEYNVISYLLKPISMRELTEALAEIRGKIRRKFARLLPQKPEKSGWRELLLPLLLDGFAEEAQQDDPALLASLVGAGILAAGQERYSLTVLAIRLEQDGKNRTTVLVHTFAGVMYGLTGFIEGARISSITQSTGLNYECDAIAACVIGGVSFVGGTGKISGIVLGVLILRIIFAALTFLAIDSSLQYIIKGLIILVACSLDMRKYLVKK